MGMNLGGMIFLQQKGFLTPQKNRVLDIGPQNVYFTTEPQIEDFVARQGATVDEATLEAEKKRLTYFSTPRPEERTTLFSEITDLTNIDYHSFDVCPALKTEILDLNFDPLPGRHREAFDVIINFGTTEHIFNQWNSFEIMHDALRVGGVIYHQLPASGYLDHGYYCYTPLFFEDLAAANGYEICELFFTPAGENFPVTMGIDIRGSEDLLSRPHSVKLSADRECVPCFNVHAILKKTRSAPFRVSLEIATAHATADEEMLKRYGEGATAGHHGSRQGEPLGSDASTEDRITALVADRERRISEIVADRDTKIAALVAEREALVTKLVDERELARSEANQLASEVDALRRSTSWRATSGLRLISKMVKR